MLRKLFDWASDEIEKAEGDLDHRLSWRFLTTPASTFSADTDIAFIALNPGGDRIPVDHPRRSSEVGSAYVYESWKSTALQNQVRCLFKEIGSAIGKTDHLSLMDKSLMAYYIPFRSPNLKSLPRQKETREFAFSLWSQILNQLNPSLIVTIDRLTFNDVCRIVESRSGAETISTEKFETGWGKCSADVRKFSASRLKVLAVARFPHLSRFRIFDRPASQKQVRMIVDAMTEHM